MDVDQVGSMTDFKTKAKASSRTREQEKVPHALQAKMTKAEGWRTARTQVRQAGSSGPVQKSVAQWPLRERLCKRALLAARLGGFCLGNWVRLGGLPLTRFPVDAMAHVGTLSGAAEDKAARTPLAVSAAVSGARSSWALRQQKPDKAVLWREWASSNCMWPKPRITGAGQVPICATNG